MVSVTFNGIDGTGFANAAERAGLVAHEGTHGIDQRASGMPMNRRQELATETHAFDSQSLVFKGLGVSDNLYGLWNTNWTDTQRQGAVNHDAAWATGHWCAEWAAAGGGCQ